IAVVVLLLALLLALLVLPVRAEDVPVCAPGQPLTLSGSAPARAGLLLTFAGRVVGGGTADAAGQYALSLVVGAEPPGSYPVTIRLRDGGTVLRSLDCRVPDGSLSTQTPTPQIPAPQPATPAPSVAVEPFVQPVAQPTAAPTPIAPPATPLSSPTLTPAASSMTAVSQAMSTPALSLTVALRAGYDANQNRILDPDEGIAGLVVYVTDPLGQVLGQAVTDERGTVAIPVAAGAEQGQLTVSIPYFAVAQQVSAASPRPQAVVIPGQARLPAVLP
ncbi:MAG TPA: hypothetical protein VFS21_33985, partial [Roseiflexaceae bacterium]|nr:hypothetical protein [Roseiflexaceae bacterium]